MTVVLAGLVAVAVTCGASPLVRRWLVHHDVLDRPNARSSHRVAIPRGGGLACLLGIAAGSAIAYLAGHGVAWPVLLAASAMALVGFVDDRVQLSVAPRLASQLVAGALLGATLAGPFGAVAGAFAFPLFVNVVNFMDGINGITAITMALWGATAGLVGVVHGSAGMAALGAVTAGSALGFLPWNAPRARMFLGDVGSYLFGGLVAGGVLVGGTDDGIPVAILLAPLSVYLIDVATALARRALRRTALTEAHREHVYQRLVDMLQLPHLIVAMWAGIVALAVVLLVYSSAGWWRLAGVTLALLTYLISVRLGKLLRSFVTRHADLQEGAL